MADSIATVIERCKGQMPDVLIGEHYGYYRHDDVAHLIQELELLRIPMVMRPKNISKDEFEVRFGHEREGGIVPASWRGE